VALTLALGAMAFGLFWLIWILIETVRLGIGGMALSLFTEMTPPPQADSGGLANAIFGSLAMVSLATALGTPIGVLAGIYLAEYGQKGWLGSATRFINDILLSAPSIVIGLFIYAAVVARTHSFSGAGRRARARADRHPGRHPDHREHARADPERAARSRLRARHPEVAGRHDRHPEGRAGGVLTGILLALARIAGETAPLLFTALSNQFWTSDLSQPMASLPVTIFKFAMSPYENWQKLAWAGVFLITLGVLLLNILARVFLRNRH
jgi:phosphate transport system permease protein